jgi:hypothetical protein
LLDDATFSVFRQANVQANAWLHLEVVIPLSVGERPFSSLAMTSWNGPETFATAGTKTGRRMSEDFT